MLKSGDSLCVCVSGIGGPQSHIIVRDIDKETSPALNEVCLPPKNDSIQVNVTTFSGTFSLSQMAFCFNSGEF